MPALATGLAIDYKKPIDMKVSQLLSHPVIQMVSFCIIFISGPYFGAPYGFYLFHAVQEGYGFAIVGILAIVVSSISIFLYRAPLQLVGTVLMLTSLLIYFTPPNGKNSYDGFRQIIPMITMILFIIIVVLALQKSISRLFTHA